MLEKSKRRMLILLTATMLTGLVISLAGCESEKAPTPTQRRLVVYTSVDQIYSEAIFKEFERQTGIGVDAVYDLEANKTTGLINRLLAEKEHPVCDVFWNNEFAQTIRLQREGVLASYHSPNASDIPDLYKDADGYWAAFGGRARVMLVNTELLAEADYPSGIYDLLDQRFDANLIAVANPMFGTTMTQAAALYAALGPDEAKTFYTTLKTRNIQVGDGNSVTRDMAAAGQVAIGFTDTDDAKGAISRNAPVTMVFPDQQEGGLGTLVCPNTVAKLNGAPHNAEAEEFIDYLLTLEVEKRLISEGFFDLSVRNNVDLGGLQVKGMSVNLYEIYEQLERASADMREIFGSAN